MQCLQLSARYTISIVSNTIYNVDPKSFEGQESEILKKSQKFLMPSKKFVMFAMMNSIYPILSRWFKLSFAVDGSTDFFIDLMKNAMDHREKSDVHPNDYLEHLLNLKKKKEISGQNDCFLIWIYLNLNQLQFRSRRRGTRGFIFSR